MEIRKTSPRAHIAILIILFCVFVSPVFTDLYETSHPTLGSEIGDIIMMITKEVEH